MAGSIADTTQARVTLTTAASPTAPEARGPVVRRRPRRAIPRARRARRAPRRGPRRPSRGWPLLTAWSTPEPEPALSAGHRSAWSDEKPRAVYHNRKQQGREMGAKTKEERERPAKKNTRIVPRVGSGKGSGAAGVIIHVLIVRLVLFTTRRIQGIGLGRAMGYSRGVLRSESMMMACHLSVGEGFWGGDGQRCGGRHIIGGWGTGSGVLLVIDRLYTSSVNLETKRVTQSTWVVVGDARRCSLAQVGLRQSRCGCIVPRGLRRSGGQMPSWVAYQFRTRMEIRICHGSTLPAAPGSGMTTHVLLSPSARGRGAAEERGGSVPRE